MNDLNNDKYDIFKKNNTVKTYKDPRDAVLGTDYFEEGIKRLIEEEFRSSASAFQVYVEGRLYRPSKNPEIMKQLTGDAPRIAEVWFKGAYLTQVSEAMPPHVAIDEINKAIFFKMQKETK